MEEWRVKFFHLRLQREMLSEILPSRKGTIDRIMEKSDLELGLEALNRYQQEP
jgi:hypothetical protein